MDRERILTINRMINDTGKMTYDLAFELVLAYCIEKGKSLDISTTFTQLLIKTGNITGYFNYALDYYNSLYTICKVSSLKDNKVLLIF